MGFITNIISMFGGAIITLIAFILLYIIVRFILNRQMRGISDTALIRQIILFSIAIMGLIAFILALPMPSEIRGQVSSFLGIILSAVFAFSSTTFIGNMLAGILLRLINNFRSGDFVKVGDYFGRVSERGLFHTELQTVDRDLITLPNLFLATNPVKVTHSQGTFISAEVSLGYDVPHQQIKNCLLDAAKRAGLTDPFVHITSLGDFSVVFKIHGLLEDIKRVLTAKSVLHEHILDTLHEADIEIVSPGFVNQRQVGETIFIPKKQKVKEVQPKDDASPEKLIFDKAEQAESLEKRKHKLEELDPKIKVLQAELKEAKDDESKATIEGKIKKLKDIKERMLSNLEQDQQSLDKTS